MKNYEAVAYSGVQYAPALCIWKEKDDNDAFLHYTTVEYTKVGYMGENDKPVSVLKWSRVYIARSGRAYVRYHNRRFYLDEFFGVF